MEIIKVRNPHKGIPELLHRMELNGVKRDSRNGPVIMFPEPATIVWGKPTERVSFWALRDTNPFFNLMEALWMLRARRDVRYVEQFVKRMRNFSDNGKNFHAAYGFRWRKNFGKDQLSEIIGALKKNPDDRRQLLGIWDVKKDLGKVGLDIPCNVGATFQVNTSGELDMVVHNRSNDGIFGATSANVSHFSILQEYIATGIGVPVGRYWQVSSNLHVYEKDFEKYRPLAGEIDDGFRDSRCPYELGEVVPTPIFDMGIEIFERDLAWFMKNPKHYAQCMESKFFTRTAYPMLVAHKAHKAGKTKEAIEVLETQMPDKSDWKKASVEWLQRRVKDEQD